MKNYKILFTLIVTLLFISCNSPKSDAEKVCDCFSELDNKKSDENKEIKDAMDEGIKFLFQNNIVLEHLVKRNNSLEEEFIKLISNS